LDRFLDKEFYERKIYKLAKKWIHSTTSKIVKRIALVGINYKGKDTYEYEHEGIQVDVQKYLFLVDCLPCLEINYFNFTKLPTDFHDSFKYLITLYLSFIHMIDHIIE